jgi:Holliday junction resolvase
MTGEGNTNKARGHAFEREVAKRLRGQGWEVVHSGGSLGQSDLVALKPGTVLLIQCKGGAKRMTHDEWNDLYGLAKRLGVVAIVADRPARGVYRYRRIVAEHVALSHAWPWRVFGIDTAAGT